jgi:tetratricopeptide (TPR) repeat protein
VEAVQSLDKLVNGACDPRASLLTAGAYEASGNTAKAEETLQAAHSNWPANTSISTTLARQYMSGGAIDRAAKVLDGFRATQATPQQEIQIATLVFIAAHRLTAAHAVADAGYKYYPGVNSILLLANVLQLEGRYKDVIRLLADKRSLYGNFAPFLITIAESEYDAMLYDAARADLERAVSLNSNSYQAHYLLGNVLQAQTEIEQAEREYRNAISLAPNQPRTYYQLALLMHMRRNDADEEYLLRRALAADDHYAPAHCELGRILLSRHQLPDAVTELSLAIRYNPQLEKAYYLLARAYAGLGQRDKADELVKQYTDLRTANRHFR